LHKSSRLIVKKLKEKQISQLVIGYNKEWKQGISIGRVNNQKFVSIPFFKFMEQLKYKCQLEGISVLTRKNHILPSALPWTSNPFKSRSNTRAEELNGDCLPLKKENSLMLM
jgi:IS605 OrfB family transposase